MSKRHVLAHQQAQAAYSRLRSGERSLRDLLETDLEIPAWESVYDSLAFLSNESSPQHAELVRAEAKNQAPTAPTSPADFLRAVQSALDLRVFLTNELRSVALAEFPHERPRTKRHQADLDEQEWFMRVVLRALGRRDYQLAYEFAFPNNQGLTLDKLVRAYVRIGEQPPNQAVLAAMLEQGKGGFHQLVLRL